MQAAPSHLSDLARGFAPEPDGAAQADKAGRGFVGQCRVSAKHRLPAREPIGAMFEQRDAAKTLRVSNLSPCGWHLFCEGKPCSTLTM